MSAGRFSLNQQFVQAVRDAADVVVLASDHTRLTRQGRQYSGLCPLHKEKSPSFSVDPDKGVFYCFGCGAGGDAITLHMLTSGDDFRGAIESLAVRFGIPIPRPEHGRDDRPRDPDLEPVLQAAQAFFQDQLTHSAFARGYLRNRDVDDEVIRAFGVGFAPEAWRELLGAVGDRIPVERLMAAGLVVPPKEGGRPYDRFRNRLMFPIHNATGRLVGFGGRTLGDDKAKYINTNETERFSKGQILYGLFQAKRAIRDSGQAILVEGYFDVIGAAICGHPNAVAGMGTALTPEQARLLGRYADEVIIGYDGDNAGEKAYRRALPLLLAEGLTVRRARFGEGQDPDSLRLEAGVEAVRDAIEGARDAILEEIDRLAPAGRPFSPQERGRAATELGELIQGIEDPIVRRDYGRRASQRLDVPEDMLWRRGRKPPRQRPGPSGDPGPGFEDAPAPPTAQGPKLVRSLEEELLRRLLRDDAEAPDEEDLPEEEIFFDPACRNIFVAYRVFYSDNGRPPSSREALDALAQTQGPIDRIAQILLESPSGQSQESLQALFEQLRRRWQKQRSRELAREIAEAQTEGDHVRLEELLAEKLALSQQLHRGPG